MKKINILHLEDDPSDAELIQARLKSGKINCEVIRVQSREEFSQALLKGKYDLILADYSLPGYDGLSALKLTQERYPDIPFIFVSGTMGEDAAISTLTQGATDYILKQKLSRLPMAVKRAQVEAENRKKRRQAELDLRESEERYRTLVENQGEGLGIVDARERFQFVNPAGHEIFGFPPGGLIGRSLLEFTRPDQSETIRQQTKLRRQGQKSSYELEIIHQDGSVRTLLVTTTPRLSPEGRYIGAFGVFSDITDRRKAEVKLQQSEARLRALFSALNDVILVVDASGRYIEIAPTNPSLLYKPAEEILGKTLHEIFPADEADFFLSKIQQTLTSRQAVHFEYSLNIDGKDVWFDATLHPLSQSSVILVARDMTERKIAKEQLLVYKEHLEDLVEKRTRELRDKQAQLMHSSRLAFLGEMATGVAHELNQPLSIIFSQAEFTKILLHDNRLTNTELLNGLDQIFTQIDRATKIIDHLRDFALYDSSYKEIIDVNKVIENSLLFFTEQFKNSNTELEIGRAHV